MVFVIKNHLPYFLNHLNLFYGISIGAAIMSLAIFLRKKSSLLSNWFQYYSIRVHESAHEKMAFLSGRRLFGYKIKEAGSGHMIYESNGKPSPLITLAPYFFSYISLILLTIRWLISGPFLLYFDIFLGFFLTFHTYIFITQTRFYQTDIQIIGRVYSVIFITLAHIFIYGLYISIIGGLKLKTVFL